MKTKKKVLKKRGRKPTLNKPTHRTCTICRSELPLTPEYFYERNTKRDKPEGNPYWGHLFTCKDCITNVEPVKRFYRWKLAGREGLPYLLYRQQAMTRAKELVLVLGTTPAVALKQAIEELRKEGKEVRNVPDIPNT